MNEITKAKVTLYLKEVKANRLLQKESSWELKIPEFKNDEEALNYYEDKIRTKKIKSEAEDLLDLAIIEQVGKYSNTVDKTLRCSWSWWNEVITSILEDRWCINISIEEREVKVWLLPYDVSDIKFSIKEILEKFD